MYYVFICLFVFYLNKMYIILIINYFNLFIFNQMYLFIFIFTVFSQIFPIAFPCAPQFENPWFRLSSSQLTS